MTWKNDATFPLSRPVRSIFNAIFREMFDFKFFILFGDLCDKFINFLKGRKGDLVRNFMIYILNNGKLSGRYQGSTSPGFLNTGVKPTANSFFVLIN